MKTKLGLVLLIVGAIVLPRSAIAATILFDFNSLAAGINSASNGSPFPAANPPPDRIEDYMEDIYGSNITVLLGAQTRTSRVENRPNGDFDMYLGNSNGATDRGDCSPVPNSACHGGNPDTFLINRWDKTSIPANLRDRIVIIFLDVPIMGFEVDWEIFPVTRSGQAADITIKADGTQIFFSELLGADKEKGDLGHFSVSFNRPVHRLEFIDWTDAPIGIDNLRVTQTPVPGTLALLVAGCLAFALSRRVRTRRPTSRVPD